MATIVVNPWSVDDYRKFLQVKSLPSFRCRGHQLSFPDRYLHLVGGRRSKKAAAIYRPSDFLFDYQADISRMAIEHRNFAVFAECGLGKTVIMLEYARYVQGLLGNRTALILSPLMVVKQTIEECQKFYGETIEQVHAKDLPAWLRAGQGIGITNYEALTDDLEQGRLGCLILDESSVLKSHYGKWGQVCLKLGAGLEWKLCLTGTPAPNDRIEYANHAVFLDAFPTVNSFLAKFFVNRGQTGERWELKPHALGAFYRALSHWCIFLTNPATYGWKDNTQNIPPINVHIHDVDLTIQQREKVIGKTGKLFVTSMGGITSRSKLGQIAKGSVDGESVATRKPEFIRNLVDSWPNESTLIWCLYNSEQEELEKWFPDAASIKGETSFDERQRLIDDFKSRRRGVLLSKPKILGFGLNLQVATRQVFSGLQDSFESFHQAVKRSNRIGSDRPLNVHIPVTELERPMIDTVLSKAHRVQLDTEEQERIFKEHIA